MTAMGRKSSTVIIKMDADGLERIIRKAKKFAELLEGCDPGPYYGRSLKYSFEFYNAEYGSLIRPIGKYIRLFEKAPEMAQLLEHIAFVLEDRG